MGDISYGGDNNSGNTISGDGNRIGGDRVTYTQSAGVTEAVTELRDLIAQLTREGAVTPDGTVLDPSAVVTAVETGRPRLHALRTAVADGAKETILTAVKGGVAALIIALLPGL